jgi:MFS family permease
VEFVSVRTLGLAAASAVFVSFFVIHERRSSEPILALRVIAGRVRALALSANLIAGLAFGSAIVYPPLFFEAVRGISATQAGLLLAPFAVTSGLCTIIAGQITDRRGGHVVVPFVGMVLSGIGMIMLSTIEATTSAAFVVGSAMLVGVGIGFVMQTLLYVIQRFTEPADIGMATSTIMLARLLGNSLGVAIVGTIFTNSLLTSVEKRLPDFPADSIQGSPQKIAELSEGVREEIQSAFALALANGFSAMIPVMAVGAIVVAFIPAKRVRDRLRSAPAEIPLVDSAAHAV